MGTGHQKAFPQAAVPDRRRSPLTLEDLEKLFRGKVLAMLLRKKKISRQFIRMLDGWIHSGFNVFAGERIQPRRKKPLENLAAYLIRATFDGPKQRRYVPMTDPTIPESGPLWFLPRR